MESQVFDRRVFLLLSSAGFFSSCTTPLPPLPPGGGQSKSTLSDAHGHFFNAADLPVQNFVRFVSLRDGSKLSVRVLRALAWIFLKVVKPAAYSVEEEIQYRRRHRASVDTAGVDESARISLNQYVEETATEIETQARLAVYNLKPDLRASEITPRTDFDVELAESSLILFSAIEYLRAGQSALIGTLGTLGDDLNRAEVDTIVTVDRAFLKAIIEDEDLEIELEDEASVLNEPSGTLQGFGEPNDKRCDDSDHCSKKHGKVGIFQALRWGWLMLQRREKHVRVYLRKITNGETTPIVTNLLVDYDRWLLDCPSKGASHIQQIDFWHELAEEYRPWIDLHTFAGFDPLKLADDTRRTPADTHWSKLRSAYEYGKFAGFKVYPPMGFRPIGNKGLRFSGIDQNDGIGDRVVNWWQSRHQNEDLGEALDTAMSEFLDYCNSNHEGEAIPILAHAGESNAAACGFGERANPLYWQNAIEDPIRPRPNLRLMLGHFTHAEDFINNMSGNTSCPVWALGASAEMIKASAMGQRHVYADIGYMEELLPKNRPRPTIAAEFFEALAAYCDLYDPKCQQICFGTDWIMLGLERGHEGYIATVKEAMKDAGWTEGSERWDNFFRKNLRRFLKIDPDLPLSERAIGF